MTATKPKMVASYNATITIRDQVDPTIEPVGAAATPAPEAPTIGVVTEAIQDGLARAGFINVGVSATRTDD